MSDNYKNLCIRAYMRTGVISDQYLPLDGVLFYHLVRNSIGPQEFSISRKFDIDESAFILPIRKIETEDGNWYYACSFAQFPEATAEDSSFKVKSGDWLRHEEHYNCKKKIDVSRGKFKNAHIKLYYRSCTHIDWYCVGDPVKIAELLRFCTSLGKNFGDGWGEVSRWTIEEIDYDWSVRGENGQLMRSIPSINGSGLLYGIRPSYWASSHIFLCELP